MKNRDRHAGRRLLLRLPTRARCGGPRQSCAQRAHAAQTSWPDDVEVRVRIGLHTGEPTLHEEGYVGLDVVRAARICTVGRGGQILLSETTRALLGSGLPEGVSVFPLGQRHLRGIDEPERVFEIAIDGLERGDVPTTEVAALPTPVPRAHAAGRAGSSSGTSRGASTISARDSQPGSRSACCARSRGRPAKPREDRPSTTSRHAWSRSAPRSTPGCRPHSRRRAFRRRHEVTIDGSLDGIDWVRTKADLAADDWDNGRSAEALRRSFEQSQHVAIARDGDRVVGMARLLSDGVCNAFIVDVWTRLRTAGRASRRP